MNLLNDTCNKITSSYSPIHVSKSWRVIPRLGVKNAVMKIVKFSTVDRSNTVSNDEQTQIGKVRLNPTEQKIATHPPYKGKNFEGLHGKSYPQWASTVSTTLSDIHTQRVSRWGPVSAGPRMVPNPSINISAGWAYSEVNPNGVAYLHIINSINRMRSLKPEASELKEFWKAMLLTHDEHCGHAGITILCAAFCVPSRTQNPPKWSRKQLVIWQQTYITIMINNQFKVSNM